LTAAGPPALLDVRGLSLTFGGLRALDGVDLTVGAAEICGLVGPNGAGKTSLFNCVSGLYRASAGTVLVDGPDGRADALRTPPHRLAGLGVARTFQQPVLQPDATVLANVLLGGHTRLPARLAGYAVRWPGTQRAERELADEARETLGWLGIGRLAGEPAGALPYGAMKRVELARALLSHPRLLLLDELASGLVHEEVHALGEVIRRLRSERGISVLLVEHHMGLVAAICDKVVVLVQGRKVAEGSAAEIQGDPVVVEAYLGSAA
jgi:branched-chain amino acid transport system ATP-binding protein